MPSTPPFPRVPTYAWRWLQRSRPVVAEAAQRLTGTPHASAAFLEGLQSSFESDPFVRDVVIDVVAEVAFSGRVPRRRPPGASWDRGLTWWAAALAGTTPEAFDGSGGDAPSTPPLFDPGPTRPGVAGARTAAPRRPSAERLALARALRSLVESTGSEHVPVSALQQLIADLEGSAEG